MADTEQNNKPAKQEISFAGFLFMSEYMQGFRLDYHSRAFGKKSEAYFPDTHSLSSLAVLTDRDDRKDDQRHSDKAEHDQYDH